MPARLSPETLAAQALGEVDRASGAVVPPIHPSTIHALDPDGTAPAGLAYTRADNPTYDHAEHLLAALAGGAACFGAVSGIAFVAISVALAASATPATRGLVMGGYSAALYLGLALGSSAFGPVVTHLGYASGFGAGAAAGLVGTVVAAVLWTTGRRDP
jgi:cystathionine beta-lyase/cystathionine gamma-synthase